MAHGMATDAPSALEGSGTHEGSVIGSHASLKSAEACSEPEVEYMQYSSEELLQGIIDLISLDLSEPYSIFTYRYFINTWPQLCYLAVIRHPGGGIPTVVGTIVCKQDTHRSGGVRGYIAMLAVRADMRKRKMGSQLVKLAVRAMRDGGCDEAVLETEVTNIGALRLYEGLGFVRDKRLHRYYLNGNDAYRLKVWFNRPQIDGPSLPPESETIADLQ
ncbi:hypothetical protein AB1Y20_009811 [Prymnesium parvum]|uniref:N-acetyltransferase domain-containing protein n=1 Tax=Prymnesium parvum TaxID=97485 RepID=A0AB34K6E9_PRYPA